MPRPSIGVDDAQRGMPMRVGVGMRRATATAHVPRLLAEEEEALGPRATQRRRVYFSLGRAAARDALADLGEVVSPVRRGADGEPLWPDGIVGAITHSGEVAMSIVGRRTEYLGLGLDIEQLEPGLSARAERLVCTPAERAWLATGPESWRTMLFSAKEAVFKALYPIERVWLAFGDAELTWHDRECSFVARLLKRAGAEHPAGSILRVQCTVTHTEVLSTTYVLA